MSLLGHKEFTPALVEAFPGLREEVEDEVYSGLLHLEMACFTRYTQAAIDAGDTSASASVTSSPNASSGRPA
jgi:hypothetical protein